MVAAHGTRAPGCLTRLQQPHIRVARVTDPPVVVVAGEIDLATVDEHGSLLGSAFMFAGRSRLVRGSIAPSVAQSAVWRWLRP
jgi:hypothetical protein